jgi:hypothetical protein
MRAIWESISMSDDRRPVQIDGRLRAKLVDWQMGLASTGNEQIGVLFELLDPPFQGRSITWYGSWTVDAFPITVRALKEMGWTGVQIATLKHELRKGTEVVLVCEVEEFNGKPRSKVKFVNRAGEIRMASTMTNDQKRAFAVELQQMLDQGMAERRPQGAALDDEPAAGGDDIPF